MRTGTLLDNPLTGQQMRLVVSPDDTNGRSFTAEWTIAPRRGRDGVPAHLHPAARETFTVHAGRARYLLGKREGELGPGEAVVMPPAVPHIHPWSVSDEELRYTQVTTADPAARRELVAALQGLQTIFALAREGKTNRQGIPNPLQMAVIGHAMMPGTFLASPPPGLQRLLLPPLAAVARLAGFRPTYPRHAGG